MGQTQLLSISFASVVIYRLVDDAVVRKIQVVFVAGLRQQQGVEGTVGAAKARGVDGVENLQRRIGTLIHQGLSSFQTGAIDSAATSGNQ